MIFDRAAFVEGYSRSSGSPCFRNCQAKISLNTQYLPVYPVLCGKQVFPLTFSSNSWPVILIGLELGVTEKRYPTKLLQKNKPNYLYLSMTLIAEGRIPPDIDFSWLIECTGLEFLSLQGALRAPLFRNL